MNFTVSNKISLTNEQNSFFFICVARIIEPQQVVNLLKSFKCSYIFLKIFFVKEYEIRRTTYQQVLITLIFEAIYYLKM